MEIDKFASCSSHQSQNCPIVPFVIVAVAHLDHGTDVTFKETTIGRETFSVNLRSDDAPFKPCPYVWHALYVDDTLYY
jgi:hypothetical protein